MSRPRKVTINGVEWSITYKKKKAWKTDKHGKGNSGETYAATFSIYVLIESINENNVREVLQHELMHACLASSGGTYVMTYIKIEDAEEVLIGTLSGTFIAMVRNNPEVREYLYGL